MKRSVNSFRSYCFLLHHYAKSPVVSCCARYHALQIRQSLCNPELRVTSPRNQVCVTSNISASSKRRLCTSSEEESQDAEDSIPYGDLMHLEQHKKENIPAHFRTKENDPTKHTIEDEGLFYRVNDEDYRMYIAEGQWNEYNKQVKTFKECVMMVRRPALEVFQLVDSVNLKLPPVKFILYGNAGNGKSMTLAHIVHKYAKEGWLTIHVPSIMEMIRVVHLRPRQIEASVHKDGRYDDPDSAHKWLRTFVEQNKKFLTEIKIQKDYHWSERQSSEAGVTLMDIANLGIDRKKFASDVIGAIFKEIKSQAESKGIKVLVAVDGVNGLWKNFASLTDEAKQPINCQDISFLHHVTRLFEPTWANGVCVGTVCQSVHRVDTNIKLHEVPNTPRFLLGKKGFEYFDPFVPILVPEYSHKEGYNYIDYLADKKWLTRPRGNTKEGRKELMTLTNRNPEQMMKLSVLW